MRLRAWVEQHGRGELTRLQLKTGIAYATLHKLAGDTNVATYAKAKVISAATGGAVSIAELCELPEGAALKKQLKKPRKRQAAKPRRKAKAARKLKSHGKAKATTTSYVQPKLAAAQL